MVLRRDRVRGGDLLLLPERVVRLNGSAAAILRLCDGRRSVDDIVAQLSERFDAPRLRADIGRFLERVRGEGWVG